MSTSQLNNGQNGCHGNISDMSYLNGSNNRGKNHIKPSDDKLPPGIKELVEECFAPGVKGYFERKTNLPLLKSTNLAILKRQKLKKERFDTLDVDLSMLNVESKEHRGRRNSIGGRFYDTNDLQVVFACWEVILSFMGDESEALDKCTQLFESTIEERRKNVTSKNKIWRNTSHADVIMREKVPKQRPISMYVTSDYNGNTNPVEPTDEANDAFSRDAIANMTVLEKVQFLTNVGLEKPVFRDEIYCQILKQLVFNSSLRSNALGWILLALIMGSFSPSEKVLGCTEMFLQHQRTACSSYCMDKLTRTLLCGDRKNPPCSLELQAAKSRLQIRVPVICMDHSVRTIWTDSATTAKEMCEKMASKNRLEDTFGFSLYLALDKKLVSLGSGNFHIMDAISQAERFSKLNEVHETWRIYYRREFFSPRDAITADENQMRVWLTYSQICGGVQSGEYQCKNAQDLALLLAHQYCVRHGMGKITMKRIVALCEQSLPSSDYGDGKKKKWCHMVQSTLKALFSEARTTEKLDSLEIMQQVVRYASKAFIGNFTKCFLVTSFNKANEPEVSVIDMTLKLNHEGIKISRDSAIRRENDEDNHSTLLKVEMENLKRVEFVQHSQREKSSVKLTVTGNKCYVVGSPQSSEITNILEHFIADVSLIAENESKA